MKKFKTLEEYFASLPKSSNIKLQQIRKLIKHQVPQAQELLSYQMPAFKLNKRILIYYAAWKEHIALYAFPKSIVEFKKDLSKYQTSKGTIKFPISKPLPLALIKKLIKFRVNDSRLKAK